MASSKSYLTQYLYIYIYICFCAAILVWYQQYPKYSMDKPKWLHIPMSPPFTVQTSLYLIFCSVGFAALCTFWIIVSLPLLSLFMKPFKANKRVCAFDQAGQEHGLRQPPLPPSLQFVSMTPAACSATSLCDATSIQGPTSGRLNDCERSSKGLGNLDPGVPRQC